MATKVKGNKILFSLAEVDVREWELIATVRGKQQYHFVVECPTHGIFEGVTVLGEPFVLAIMAYPDKLYNVELVTTKTTCTMLDGYSFKREINT